MPEGVTITSSYLRFNGGALMEMDVPISVQPIIRRGRRVSGGRWAGGATWYVEPDKLAWMNLRIGTSELRPEDGIFEFWTKQWVGDDRDPDYPWWHHKYPALVWHERKRWFYARAKQTGTLYSTPEDENFMGFWSVKEVV